MFKNFVTFKDAVELAVPEIPEQVIEFYDEAQLSQEKVTPLRVRIAATHAARPTRNHGLYLPDKMKKGTQTFLKPFPKPILTHHNHKADAIGRVAGAKYIDISNGAYKTVQDSSAEYLDKLRDFTDGKLSRKEAVDFAIEFMDAQNVFDADYEGLGFIELVAEITDADAIRKVIDKRYLTGSVNASTNSAICTICKTDWADEDRCEHIPGEIYNKKVCLLIAGDLMYHEYSFVNKPADTISGVVDISVNGITDSVQVKQFTTEDHKQSIYEIALFEQRKQGDHFMTFKQVIDQLKASGKFDEAKFEDKAFLDAVKTSTKTCEDIDAFLVELKDHVKEPEKVDVKDDEVDEVKKFYGETYDEIVGDDPWGRQYAEMMLTLLEDAEDVEAAKKELEDAKLSSEARKKLPGSAFCGPDRSFPVNDCAHYTAALRLLNRYQGPGSKSKIRACIQRKGKRLGCVEDETQDNTPDPTVYSTVDYFDQFEDHEVQDMFQGLLLAIEDRDLECGCTDNSEKIKALEDEIKTLKEGKNVEVSDEKIKKALDASKAEVKYLQEDIEHMTQALIDVEAKLRQAYVEQIADFTNLSGKETTMQEILDEVKDAKESDLQQKLKSIKEKVDIKKLSDTLNSGIANQNAQGEVDDPTKLQDNTQDKETEEVVITDEMLRKVEQEYLSLIFLRGKTFADAWFENLKHQGVIPKELSTPDQK